MTDRPTNIKFRYEGWNGDWHSVTAQRWAFDIRSHDWDDQLAVETRDGSLVLPRRHALGPEYSGRRFSGNVCQSAADELAERPWLGNIASTPPGRVHSQRAGVAWLTQCGRDFGSTNHGRAFPMIVNMPVTCKSCLRSDNKASR